MGLSLNGPSDRPEDFSDWDKLRVKVVVSEEIQFYCARRHGPAA